MPKQLEVVGRKRSSRPKNDRVKLCVDSMNFQNCSEFQEFLGEDKSKLEWILPQEIINCGLYKANLVVDDDDDDDENVLML